MFAICGVFIKVILRKLIYLELMIDGQSDSRVVSYYMVLSLSSLTFIYTKIITMVTMITQKCILTIAVTHLLEH